MIIVSYIIMYTSFLTILIFFIDLVSISLHIEESVNLYIYQHLDVDYITTVIMYFTVSWMSPQKTMLTFLTREFILLLSKLYIVLRNLCYPNG